MRRNNELTPKDLKDVCNPNFFKFETGQSKCKIENCALVCYIDDEVNNNGNRC